MYILLENYMGEIKLPCSDEQGGGHGITLLIHVYVQYIVRLGSRCRSQMPTNYEVFLRFPLKKFCMDFKTSVIFGLSFGSSAQHVLIKHHN